MKKVFLLNVLASFFTLLLILQSCKQEATATPKVTYSADVKSIIDNSCAYSGCHSGSATATPWVPTSSKNLTVYDSLKVILDNGKFHDRVIVQKNMPDAKYVPSGKPAALTQSELDLLARWKEGGYQK